MILSFIILSSLEKMNLERTVFAPFYILQGKPSIQTIQDASLYGLSPYFGIYRKLTKEQYGSLIQECIDQSLLTVTPDNKAYQLTSQGLDFLHVNRTEASTYYFNGNKFKQQDELFYYRLLLFIQVLTNSKAQHYSYVPIIGHKETTLWMKQVYPIVKPQMKDILSQLHKELENILIQRDVMEATIFVEQLSGYQIIGRTMTQLMMALDVDRHTIQLKTISAIHFILQTVRENRGKYRILSFLCDDLFAKKQLNQSTKKTETLLYLGKSVEEIASIRKLKLNTIFDHIVEMALIDDGFSLQPYMTEAERKEIIEAIESLESYKLKTIKEAVSSHITYFQIRLVLAKMTNQ